MFKSTHFVLSVFSQVPFRSVPFRFRFFSVGKKYEAAFRRNGTQSLFWRLPYMYVILNLIHVVVFMDEAGLPEESLESLKV